MDSQTIREALGTLQVEPDSDSAWSQLSEAASSRDGDLSKTDLLRLLDRARKRHGERGEWEAVSRILETAVSVAAGGPEEVDLVREQARVLSDELFDDEGAAIAYYRLVELAPSDKTAHAAIEESESKKGKYKALVETYMAEVDAAPDDVYASSMLMRAAEMELRFAGDEASPDGIAERLERAVRLDPTNVRAGRMLERIYRLAGRWEDVGAVLERMADRGETPEARVGAGIRLARVYSRKLDDKERASRAYMRVLRDNPEHAEAKEFLSEFYSAEERWDDLVSLYEAELKNKDMQSPDRLGDIFQIAMLHWRKREKPADAEPWFDRLRRIEPTHEGMLNFYREFCAATDNGGLLVDVLSNAQKALTDSSKRAALAGEIGKLAEGQENAHKAIEQYKAVLRQNPDEAGARDALKRLYRQTQGHNALVELLRQELERTPVEEYEKRLEILRDVAAVYRLHIKSDTALVSVLNQIVNLDNKLDIHDIAEVRELVALYEKLSRWRDLLTTQLLLADITDDVDEKKTLYRSVARRWLDQFSNVQQATEAYAALLKIDPEDSEARERLEELYRKRRAWPALYDLYEAQLSAAAGGRRLTILREMAQLASERLNRGADAVKLYKQILEVDPSNGEVLDTLEKHAERAKDWETLSEVLERRVQAAADDAARLAVLQKLGAVYADQIGDPKRAAGAWRRVLELQPGHARALRVLRDAYLASGSYDALSEMYGAQNDWEGLAEVLSNAADRAKDSETKVDLSYRAALVYEERLNQPERAFRSYERILGADPTDARAAAALIPIYEKEEKWARLPALYELLCEKADTEENKLELLERLVEVTGRRLSDKKAALSYAKRAYELAPGNERALGLFEEAARAASSWEPFVEALEARLAAASGATAPAADEAPKKKKKKKKGAEPEPEAQAELSVGAEERLLELKLARVYADELGKIDDAVRTYKRLLEHEPTDSVALDALELILKRADRRDDLRWLTELRVVHAGSDTDRVELLVAFAALEEDVFESSERAIDLYRRAIEIDPTHRPSLSSLPRLLLSVGDAEGAGRVLEGHRDQLAGDERAGLEVELANLYLNRLDRPSDAIDVAVNALGSPTHRAAGMEVLERLLDHPQARTRAAEVLASEYASGGESRREAQALGILLERDAPPEQRLELYRRLASVQEEKLGSFGAALDVILKAAKAFPKELELWDQAERLATAAGRPTDLGQALHEALRHTLPRDVEAELCQRAARLHEDRLGDPIGATPYLEKVLEIDPGNEGAFGRLKDILTAAERWGELEALYDRASSAAGDSPRRVEMLVEVALICEEIIEDSAKATRYYERILEADPHHDAAIRALDRLYAKQGKSRDLATLIERRLESAVGDELSDLKLRLAQIRLDLLEPEKAIDHVEDVLIERPSDHTARELAERMLEIGSLRVRAARMLEAVYEARHEIRDLNRVLSIRLEGLNEQGPGNAAREDERRELLRRIAKLRVDRLHDDQGALDALASLVPADPLDSEARTRLLEVGRRVGAHARVADVLVQAAEHADTPSMQGEILMQVAAIYEDLLGDQERAEQTYRRVLTLDESDAELVLPAARALERIYLGKNDPNKLAEMLRAQVRLEQDGERRRELFGRLGELCQNTLGDNAGAIEAWRARLEEDPSDAQALAALDALYEQTEQWRELVQIIDRRREITDDEDQRKRLMERSAQVLSTRLAAVTEAIEAYQNLVIQAGPSARNLTALEGLFATAGRWDELGDTYEQHLDIADGDVDRLELLAKLGTLKHEHQNDLDGALDAYRRALSIDAGHASSRTALEKLLESEDSAARRQSAEILHPIFETEGDHERLLKVIEIEVTSTDDLDARLDGLSNAIRVAEGPLGDPKRAFDFAERAVRLAAGHTALNPWLEHLDRLSEATGRRAEHVKLLCDVVDNIFDGDVQLAVTQQIADLARHKLADRDLAREYYQKALELRPDDRKTLTALESLYEEAGDAQHLLEVLERRVDTAESDAEKKGLLFRRARLLADALSDKPRAIGVYEEILDLELDRGAIEALEGLYRDTERHADLIQLYQRQLDTGIGTSADLRVRIAEVAARKQGDIARAFDELEGALEIERQHAAAIAELERLLAEAPEPEQRARAASLLEPVYLLRADYDRVMNTLRARLEFASDPDERRELLTRLAQLYEEQKEDYLSALETVAKLLPEDLGDERTVSELERLAKVAGAQKRLAEIYATELEGKPVSDEATARLSQRAGDLFAELGSLDKALGFFDKALAYERENRTLFNAVDGILKRTDRHRERVELYRSALDYRFDAPERLEALHTIADLQRAQLGEFDEAIETYRAALDVDDTDARALDALTDLYRERERWDDLADLYLRRAESAVNPDKAANHRLALARLCKNQLKDPTRAIDQLEEIVRALPEHEDAIKELESLRDDPKHKERVIEILRPIYESADDWHHLIRLNEDRFELAQDIPDKIQILSETARLWEQRGHDLNRARRALAEAIRLDADDPDVRTEYERLVGEKKAWNELAKLYEEVLEDKPDLGSKRELLSVLASVHDTRRDDPRRALDAYARLRALDEADLEPLAKIETLSTLLSDWKVLVSVLSAKAELLLEDQERAAVWRRVAECRRDMLDDSEGAIEAYERALELDSEGAVTVDRLIELYEAKRAAERLVELYQRRVELAGEGDTQLKYELLVKSATTYSKDLADNPRAIEALNRALEVRENDADVLGRLNQLYREQQMWSDLLDNLRLQASTAEDTALRVRLRKEIGDVLADKMESFEDALEAYRQVLDEAPDNAEAVAAVRRIGQDHDLLRNQVATVLVPVLRQSERYEDLVEVLELRLSTEVDPDERTETLRGVAEVLDTRLKRPADAQAALLRALAERPENRELHSDIERLSDASGDWTRYADALSERAQATFDPEIGKDLNVRIGRIAEDKLKDDRRAVEAYRKAVELAGDQPELLEALDRLYQRLGEATELSEILERRIGIEESPEKQAELYYRLAIVQIRDFKDPARGLGSLRTALEKAPGHEGSTSELEKLTDERDLFEEAAEVLEGVYRSRAQTDRLATLYEKRVGFAGTAGERIDMRKSLARVLEEDCRDAASAQRVLQQGLLDDPSDAPLLEEIERLAGQTQNWEGAAAALREAIDKKTDLPSSTAAELCVRLAGWQRDKVENRRAAEDALNKALEFEPDNDDVLVLLEALQRDSGREADLIKTLRRRAKLQSDPERREELYRQAKGLADGINDSELCEAILRELLAADDSNAWALGELTKLREAAGDYKETFELLVRQSSLPASDATVRELKKRAAEIAREKLSDDAQAIELYAQLFEDDPRDADSSAALRALYERTEGYKDLAKLLERLIDQCDTPPERSKLRIELARLQQERFKASDAAIELLRSVLEEEPSHADAVVALSELFEATSRDEELAELLNSQIEAARGRSDTGAELTFQVRLGDVYESRLKNRGKAIDTYRAVLERDGTHRGALESLARLLKAEDRLPEAAEILEKLVELSQGDEAIELALALADTYAELKDNEKTARALEKGLVVDKANSTLRGRLRKLYESMQAWDRLADILAGDSDLMETVEDKVRLLRQAADIHLTKQKNSSAAAELLAKASQLKPDDREILLELCDAYSASGRGKDAAAVLEKIVESYGGKRAKELAEIHRRLAVAYLADGDSQRALEELDKAFRIEPGNVSVLKKLGEVALATGDLKKAQQMFRALLLQKLDPSSPITKAQVFLSLGEVHEKLGEKDKAVQMLERAVQSDDSLQEAKTRLAVLKGG